jgi:putative transposase
MTKVPASERTRQTVKELIEGRLVTADARSELVRLAARLIVEEALEAEVSDVLGRGYDEQGDEPRRGYRNGYRPGRLKTAERLIEDSAPQVSDRDEPFRNAIRGRSAAREHLAVEMFARGLSTRDIDSPMPPATCC